MIYFCLKSKKKSHRARGRTEYENKKKRYKKRKSQPELVIISPLHPRNVRTQIQEAGRESGWAWSIRIQDKEWAWPMPWRSYSPPLGPVIWAHHVAQPGDQTLKMAGSGGRGCMKMRGRGRVHHLRWC